MDTSEDKDNRAGIYDTRSESKRNKWETRMNTQNVKRKLTAILSADVEGYSRLATGRAPWQTALPSFSIEDSVKRSPHKK